MPRPLPWMKNAGPTEKKGRPKPVRPSPTPACKRASSPNDVVNSDLDDIEPGPAPKSNKQRYREPSSSPPPPVAGPPPVQYMKEGLHGDDVFMMVEDEFYSTAQLFTKHIHHAEYVRLKTLHKSRGRETIARLNRGTDTSTAPSRKLLLKKEAEDNARKQKDEMRKMAYGNESSDEDEYMFDPQLSSLMTGSQLNAEPDLSQLSKAGIRHKVATYSQSPDKPTRTRDAFTVGSSSKHRFSPVEEEDEEEETDSDDLDVRPSRPRVGDRSEKKTAQQARNPPRNEVSQGKSIFSRFARPSSQERKPAEAPTPPRRKQSPSRPRAPRAPALDPSPPSSPPTRYEPLRLKRRLEAARLGRPPSPVRIKEEPKSAKRYRSSATNPAQHSQAEVKIEQASPQEQENAFMARRRAAKEQRANEERKALKEEDNIPTFLF